MKKFAALFLAATLLLSLFSLTVSAAGATISASSVTTTPGSKVTITATLSGNPGIAALIISPKCDYGNIAFATASEGNISGFNVTTGANIVFDAASNVTENGVLASATFVVIDDAVPGTYDVYFVVRSASNADMENVSISTVKGTIKVVCATHSYGGYTNANASSHTRTCSACGNVETTGHRWDGGTQTKPASCKETGNKLYTCLDCGATKNETIAKTNNHTFGGWSQTSAPSCTGKGSESRTCSTCQKVESRDIKATGHSMGNWTTTKEAKCTTAGEQTRSCSKCSHKETKSIAALGHSFSNPTVTKQPTCTETGIESGKCTRCNQQTTNTIRATGHKMTSFTVTLEPTCTAEGTKAGTCSVCGASAQEAIPATGHTFGEAVVTKEATETETGVKTATCTACGETQEEEIPYLSEVIPEDEETDTPNDMEEPAHDKKGNTAWIWIVVGVAVVGVAAIVAYIILKDKKKTEE